MIALSGRMDEESIAEVEALIRMDASGRRLVLDLRDVTLAGQEAVDFLADAKRPASVWCTARHTSVSGSPDKERGASACWPVLHHKGVT